ncbi:hypothetical protein MMC19_005726 [Ptychographa xylographoides]|nr:hypothetical protein [Ptychographa xylographoides]
MVVLPPTEEPSEYNSNYILYWNNVCLDLTRLVNTIAGPQSEPPSSARSLGILHLAINDAYFSIKPDSTGLATTYLTKGTDPTTSLPDTDGANDAQQAVAGAAITVLEALYTTPDPTIATATTLQLSTFIQAAVTAFPVIDTLSSSYRFGIAVGQVMLNLLNIKPGQPGFGQDSFRVSHVSGEDDYKFGDDPTNPIRIVPVDVNNPNGPTKAVKVYDAPFYGMTATRLAVQGVVNGAAVEHIIADPPKGFSVNDNEEYDLSFSDVYREGGAQTLDTTKRTPDQTATGFFWAYDAANLIGTPPRIFNQILRKVAFERKPAGITDEKTNADFARLFALANATLGDAGIFAWLEKYCFQFWRPLTGVRDAAEPMRDPFWLTLGSPSTNNDTIPFKPPFPSYPSGHATFAGSFFQMVRLYYKRRDDLTFAIDEADNIGFDFVSDELNGVSRDLRQAYDPNLPITDQEGTIRTRVVRHFPSLWAAMFDTALSRTFLGVHWRFDAFSSEDVLASTKVNANGTTAYKLPSAITYKTMGPRGDRPGKLFPIGGVPLGIGIANDIFQSNLKQSPPSQQPNGRFKCGGNTLPAATSGGSKSFTMQQMEVSEQSSSNEAEDL